MKRALSNPKRSPGGKGKVVKQNMAIPGHSEEAGLEICRQLGIDPSRVLSIDIFALHGTLVVKTLDGDVHRDLVPEKDKDSELPGQ